MAPSARRVPSQPLAIGLGIVFMLGAMWAFDEAWEARGEKRPRLARYLAV